MAPEVPDTEEFQAALAGLINANSLEQGCDMPDWAIAEYLTQAYYSLCQVAATKVIWGLSAEVSINALDPQIVVRDAHGNEYADMELSTWEQD